MSLEIEITPCSSVKKNTKLYRGNKVYLFDPGIRQIVKSRISLKKWYTIKIHPIKINPSQNPPD